MRVPADNYYELVARTRDAGFGDEPKRRIMLGTYALSAGYYEAYYGQAQKVRTVIAREFAAAFERFDVLISPTSPTVAFKLGEKVGEPVGDVPRRRPRPFRRTWPGCRACRSPAASRRVCRSGLQLIGAQFSENTLFRAGHALERAIGFDTVPERLR